MAHRNSLLRKQDGRRSRWGAAAWSFTRSAGAIGSGLLVLGSFLAVVSGPRVLPRIPGAVVTWLTQPLKFESPVRKSTETAIESFRDAAQHQSTATEVFVLGSTEQDVIRIQGRPQRVVDGTWFYGNSQVRFIGGRVVSWVNSSDKPLRAK